MTEMYKARIHNNKRGKYTRYAIFYGVDPMGPRGGTMGNVKNAEQLTAWYAGTGSYGVGAPEWMKQAAAELEKMQIRPEYVKVSHRVGSASVQVLYADTQDNY